MAFLRPAGPAPRSRFPRGDAAGRRLPSDGPERASSSSWRPRARRNRQRYQRYGPSGRRPSLPPRRGVASVAREPVSSRAGRGAPSGGDLLDRPGLRGRPRDRDRGRGRGRAQAPSGGCCRSSRSGRLVCLVGHWPRGRARRGAAAPNGCRRFHPAWLSMTGACRTGRTAGRAVGRDRRSRPRGGRRCGRTPRRRHALVAPVGAAWSGPGCRVGMPPGWAATPRVVWRWRPNSPGRPHAPPARGHRKHHVSAGSAMIFSVLAPLDGRGSGRPWTAVSPRHHPGRDAGQGDQPAPHTSAPAGTGRTRAPPTPLGGTPCCSTSPSRATSRASPV
jgi:hypothetical protein